MRPTRADGSLVLAPDALEADPLEAGSGDYFGCGTVRR